MRRRTISAAAFLVLAAFASIVAVQQYTHSSQLPTSSDFVVDSVQRYDPKRKDLPSGFQLSIPFNAESLRVGDGQSVELDLIIDPTLAKLYSIRDAVLTNEKATTEDIQPYFKQTPPAGVDARLMFTGLQPTKYGLELYFAPREGRPDPELGMKFFATPELRSKNLRILIANR